MLLKLENQSEIIDTNNLEKIGQGKDGIVYQYNQGLLLKQTTSGYMTEEKIKDLRNAVPNAEDERIVVPIHIATPFPAKQKRMKLNPATGYSERQIQYFPNSLSLKTETFLEEISILQQELHLYFSKNKIAITDSNPENILHGTYQGKDRLYLIDHDRNITAHSMDTEKDLVQNGNYELHNEQKMTLLFYKFLLLQLSIANSLEQQEKHATTKQDQKIQSYIELECTRYHLTRQELENIIKPYFTIEEYVTSTIKKIKKKK